MAEGSLFSPEEALSKIISIVDAKYRPYLRTGATSFKEVVDAYRAPQGIIPAFVLPLPQKQIDELVLVRNALLTGENLEDARTSVFQNFVEDVDASARVDINTVFNGVRYVEETADPREAAFASEAPAAAGMAEELRAGRTTPEDAQAIIQSYIDRGLSAIEARQEFERVTGQVAPADTDVEDEPGGVPGGGSVVGGVGPAPVETGVPEDWEAAAAEIYGGYYAIIKQNQEIADLLLLATTEGWDDAKFQYQLEQTNWWKDVTGFAREFDMREARDPATVATEISNRAATLREYGLSIGLPPGSVDYETIARDSLRMGWSDQVTENVIGYRATQTTPGQFGLVRGYYGNQVRDLMRDYGQSLDAETFKIYVNDLATGNQSLETLKYEAVEAAKTLFPGLADRLDRGQTFQQIARPYRNTAAAILEIDPNSIDFTNPDWAQIFTYVDPKGEQRPMNYNEMGDYLRTTRSFGYEYTDQAKQKAYRVANELANLFGAA